MPALPPDEIDATILRMRSEGEGWSAIGHVVGLSRDSARRRHEKLTSVCQSANGDGSGKHPHTASKAEIRSLYKRNPGLDIATMQDLLAELRSEGAARASESKPRIRWVPQEDRHCLEVCIFDAHIGKLAWAPETGEDYDIGIACQRVEAAVDDLLAQAKGYAVERILLPLGNDFIHYDTLTGLTTAGTPQDRDSRYAKMYLAAFALARSMIDRCKAVAPVEVVVVPGNHDTQSMFTLGVAVEAWYHDDRLVTVDNSSRKRKYKRYGATLLGYAHGNSEPVAKLPSIMPVEAKAEWSETRFWEWHLGHIHTSKRVDAKPVDGTNGVRVRFIQSLSGVDAWHAGQGYVGEPGAAEAFIWSYDRGLRANLFSTVYRAAA